MRVYLTQNEKEYRRSTERWENEGGHWLHVLSTKKIDDQEDWEIKEFKMISPLDAQRDQRAAPAPTSFNSTYFMKLWNANPRTAKPHRASGQRKIVSINADNHFPRIPFAEK